MSSVWGHSVHFAKFPMLRFSKDKVFMQVQPNPTTESMYSWLCQILEVYGPLKIFYLSQIASIHKANVGFIWQKVK